MPDTAADWNPRYLAYVKARGVETPEQMKVIDGNNANFMRWANGHASAWQKLNPQRRIIGRQDEFDAFIAGRPHCHRCPDFGFTNSLPF
jgi:hypothetical protein